MFPTSYLDIKYRKEGCCTKSKRVMVLVLIHIFLAACIVYLVYSVLLIAVFRFLYKLMQLRYWWFSWSFYLIPALALLVCYLLGDHWIDKRTKCRYAIFELTCLLVAIGLLLIVFFTVQKEHEIIEALSSSFGSRYHNLQEKNEELELDNLASHFSCCNPEEWNDTNIRNETECCAESVVEAWRMTEVVLWPMPVLAVLLLLPLLVTVLAWLVRRVVHCHRLHVYTHRTIMAHRQREIEKEIETVKKKGIRAPERPDYVLPFYNSRPICPRDTVLCRNGSRIHEL